MPKTPQMSKSAANPSGGSLAFETIPLNYVVDTQGEFRWWLEPQAIYDGINYDIADRGYAMGFFPTKSGTYTFVQPALDRDESRGPHRRQASAAAGIHRPEPRLMGNAQR